MQIRRFDYVRDGETVVSWLPDLYNSNFPGFLATSEFLSRRRQALREAVRHPGQTVLIADDGRGPVGFVWLGLEIDTRSQRRGEIVAVYVVPRQRGCGVGRLLMAEADATFHLWGCVDAHLMVTADNVAAVDLYRKLGYTVTRYQMEKPIRSR